MARLKERIQKRIHMTTEAFQNDCAFSKKLAFLRMTDELSNRAGLHGVSDILHHKKDEWILKYLSNSLMSVIHESFHGQLLDSDVSKAPIWVFWWDGEKSAPPLVQQCIKSIRLHAGNHPVHMISKENLREYIEIPTYIQSKVDLKQMKFAHFADYVRVKLLYQYGGLWLDSTIYCNETIPDWYFEIPFFTCKSEERKSRFVSNYRWCTFCLGGWKNSVVFEFLMKAFEIYWSSESLAIDYLLFDYIIALGYNNIPEMCRLIDGVPVNNIHRDDLQAAMNRADCAAQWNTVIRPDTVLYKLSWREAYSTVSANGVASIYAHFLEI